MITKAQRVQATTEAIQGTLEVIGDREYIKWADGWLNGTDTSKDTAITTMTHMEQQVLDSQDRDDMRGVRIAYSGIWALESAIDRKRHEPRAWDRCKNVVNQLHLDA